MWGFCFWAMYIYVLSKYIAHYGTLDMDIVLQHMPTYIGHYRMLGVALAKETNLKSSIFICFMNILSTIITVDQFTTFSLKLLY